MSLLSLYGSPASVRPESMPTWIWTPPLYVDESKYLAIVNPYPPNANLDLYPNQRTLALWLASCAGQEVLRSLFYKPAFPEMVVVEVNYDFHELLGQHVWSEFLMEPTKEQRGRSSTVFYSTFNRSRLAWGDWTCVKIEEHWFQGWSANNSCNYPLIKYPYPKSSHCDAASNSYAKFASGEPVCRLLPQQPFALPLPPPAPGNYLSSTPSLVVANPWADHRIKNDARKPPFDSLRPSVGASRAPSAVGSSISRSSRGAPPAFPRLGRRLASPSRTSEHFNWGASEGLGEGVEHPELEQVNNAPAYTPAPTHFSRPERRQLDELLGSIEPSRVYEYTEEDEPRHSTEAAMADLFDDGFFVEAPSAAPGGGGTSAPDPDDPDYDPWNPPAEAENLWEGYDTPRLELPTKVKKNGEWTCPQHGSTCTPGICKERAKFERDERMRNNREKWEDERVPRGKRGRPKKGTKAAVTGEWRSSPPHLRGNSSSTATTTTATTSNSNNESDDDTADTSRDPGSIAPLRLGQDDSSLDGFRLNAGATDTQSTVSFASRPVAQSDDGDIDERASVAKSRTTNTGTTASRNNRTAPPASVSSRGQNKGPASPATPLDDVTPTSPRLTPQPASDARSSASQSPSVGRHRVVPSLSGNSRPASVSAASSNTGPATRKSASEARSSVSSRAWTGAVASTLSTSSWANDDNPIAAWLAKVRAETAKGDGRRNGRKAANVESRQKVSKGARKRQNKTKTARVQAQAQEREALASILEAEIEVEPVLEGPGNEWGDPNVVW